MRLRTRDAATFLGDNRRAPKTSRWRIWAGIAGPAAFTAAWIVSGLGQGDYSIRDEHISGLAAPDARAPAVMIAGFLALGGSMVFFASALRRRLGGSVRAGVGPALMASAGICTALAGILRRDRMANRLPEGTEPYRQSAVNDAHDVLSVSAQACGVAATLALSRRLRGEPELEAIRRPMIGAALVTGGLGAYFASKTERPGNGIVQRVGVTLSLAGMAALAWRMLQDPTGPARNNA